MTNVTFDPDAFALPARSRAIEEILDLDDGVVLAVEQFISFRRYADLVRERVIIKERLTSHPRYTCALCGTPVYLVANPNKTFFFRHRIDDGSCAADTRTDLSRNEMLARKYHGLRESEPHKRLKALISRSLKADARFAHVAEEKTWRSLRDATAFRRPDVQTSIGSLRLAFELQLSTTFLDVVVGRRVFYRQEGALLVWVFGRFTPDDRRLMEDDILFSNNSNIFVVDDETTALSEAQGVFHLRCHYRQPAFEGGGIGSHWATRIVRFDDLTRDIANQQLYLFDFDGARRELLEQGRLAESRAAREKLRADFVAFWLDLDTSDDDDGTARHWSDFRSNLGRFGVQISRWPDHDPQFRALMNAMLSAELGKPARWKFKQLVEVGHYLNNGYKTLLLPYGYALEFFGRQALIKAQDQSRKWQARSDEVRDRLLAKDSGYLPDEATLTTLDFFYPSIAEKVRRFLTRRKVT